MKQCLYRKQPHGAVDAAIESQHDKRHRRFRQGTRSKHCKYFRSFSNMIPMPSGFPMWSFMLAARQKRSSRDAGFPAARRALFSGLIAAQFALG